jgi:aminocarboxymuconate-semialdehyde decarboxylase
MFTRRDFLANSAIAVLFQSTGASRAQQTSNTRVIDIHAHWYPPQWLSLIEKEAGDNGAKVERNARGNTVIVIPGLSVTFQPRYTDIASRLKAMDAAGVGMHAVSLTQPMVYWATPAFGLKLSQAFNDACSALHLEYPERFVGLAMLPMQAPDLAVDEVARAGSLPGIRGVYMSTHVRGENLDEKAFWPVYERCEALGLPIFLHPTNTLGADRMRNYYLRNFLGNPYETGIAAASLMFGGVMDAFPKLEVVLPQAGGPFPWLLGRMTHGATVRQEVKELTRPPLEYKRRFYYDTIAHNHEILLDLVRFVGADRVVCGTDFPADMSDVAPVATVGGLTELSADEHQMILGGNAARLLKL